MSTKQSTREELEKRLEALVADKKLSAERGSSDDLVPKFQPWDIPQLDEITGGIPLEKFTLLYGESSHGKTLLTMFAAKSFQQANKLVALVDAEQSFDPRWWQTIGVDTNLMSVHQPAYGEEAVMEVERLIGKVDLLILDSLAALIPLREQEVDLTKKGTMGLQAQLITDLYKKSLSKAKKSGTALMFINQVRDNFDNPYVVQLPGGRAQRFYSHMMIEVARHEWMKDGVGNKTGFNMRIRLEKNKLGLAYQTIFLPFSFEGVFDFLTLLVGDAIDRGVIQNAGAYYRFPADIPFDPETTNLPNVNRFKVNDDGTQQVMGRDSVHALLEANPQAAKLIELQVYDKE